MSHRELRYKAASAAATAVGALLLLGPFEAREATVPLGPLALTFTELLAAFAVTVAAGALLVVMRQDATFRGGVLARLRGPAPWLLAAWASVHLLSAVWADADAAESLKFGMRTAGGVALGLVSFAWASERSFLRRIEGFVLAALATMFAIAIVERTGGQAVEPFLGLFRTEPTWMLGEQRLATVFYHANTLAAWVELLLPWALVGAASRTGRRRIWPIVLAFGAIWMLGLTYSRAGLAAGILAAVALLFASRRGPGWRSLRWMAGGAVVLIAASYVANPDMRARLGLEERRYEVEYRFEGDCEGEPGERIEIPVAIHNDGEWPLSNRQAPGELAHVAWPEEGRPDASAFHYQRLPPVPPGEEVTLTLAIELPQEPGSIDIVVDIRRKNVIWLSAVGVEPGRLHCVAGPAVAEHADRDGDQDAIRLQGRPLELERRHYWQAALRLLAERPVLGHGADQFHLRYRRFVPPRGWDGRARAHSIVVETAADLGALGLLALGLWVGLLLFRTAGLLAGGRNSPRYALAAAVGCCAFLAHGMVDYFLAYTQIVVVFWPLLGIALAGTPPHSKDASR